MLKTIESKQNFIQKYQLIIISFIIGSSIIGYKILDVIQKNTPLSNNTVKTTSSIKTKADELTEIVYACEQKARSDYKDETIFEDERMIVFCESAGKTCNKVPPKGVIPRYCSKEEDNTSFFGTSIQSCAGCGGCYDDYILEEVEKYYADMEDRSNKLHKRIEECQKIYLNYK